VADAARSATGLLIFLVAPILVLLPLSVNDSEFLTYPMRGLTWRWYEQVFTDPKWRLAVQNSRDTPGWRLGTPIFHAQRRT
jgi:ABC-type spermidine/putrescine transport system permease subunit II